MEKKKTDVRITQLNKEILKELSNIKPKAYNRAKRIFPYIEDWMTGKDYPTYDELAELSKIFKIPFGYFFLKELPKYNPPIPISNAIEHEDLIDTIKLAEEIQDWAKDFLTELGWKKTDFDFSKVKISKSSNLQSLIDEIEKNGIFVLILKGIEEYAGFVLYDDMAPVITINSANTIEEKINTLIDAVEYVADKKSGIIDRKINSITNNEEIYISRRFLQLIDSAVSMGIITYVDAMRIVRFDDY
ncbi:MAG: hypothetical protein JHC31_02375 [Sulfurihydrogenibium sp.]|jgi:transcriptional regulator with XRE-family HTH domain|nr:hypothetical protein [Sulfurihydrogenibium sp.]